MKNKRRICHEVILEMLQLIPKTETDLISDLLWNYEDSTYKPPEETIQWNRTMQTLIKHIPTPEKDWEWDVLSIFTTKPIEELKQL